MNRTTFALGGTLLLFLAIASCTSDGPTEGTPLSEPSSARTGLSGVTSGSGVSGATSTGAFNAPSAQEEDEEFNCTNVQHVQARFSSPGFVNDNVAGLFVEFAGFPDVNRTLRVWWDEENAPEKYEDIPLADSDYWKVGDQIAFDKLIEHTYSVTEEKEFRVRVELFLADLTGNCARVRRVTVGPPSATAGGGGGGGGTDCATHPQWMPVTCTTGSWVWSSSRANTSVAAASAAHTLHAGCSHAPAGNTCSLTGAGWVSTATFAMSGCNTDWYHLGGSYTGNCGGHDGDVIRHLAMGPNDCYNY